MDTNNFFVGGAGMFIQYHDVIKPAYFYALMRMIISGHTYGVPTDIVSDLSLGSMIEWYKSRRYINPLKQLDIEHKTDDKVLNDILSDVLSKDESIYSLSPLLNIGRMFSVYTSQHLSFPIYVYSEQYERGIENDCKSIFNGIKYEYVHGDLKECILNNCDQNFTYIFSDIELTKSSADILTGSYSHILQSTDYRYNYKDSYKNMKYDLEGMMFKHPFIRIGTTSSFDMEIVGDAFQNIVEYKES